MMIDNEIVSLRFINNYPTASAVLLANSDVVVVFVVQIDDITE